MVAFDQSSFIALYDSPGLCPGDGWQLIAHGTRGDKGLPGPRGEKGSKGDRGEPGEPAATIAEWRIDREAYCITPLMSDGRPGPILELRELFAQYDGETR